MDAQKLMAQIQALPENLQLQVADYTDFLFTRYLESLGLESGRQEENVEISDELKRVLDREMALDEANPQEALPWEEVMGRMLDELGKLDKEDGYGL